MIKYFCDLCKNEHRKEDLIVLKFEKEDKPVVRAKQICIWCKENILKILNRIEGEAKWADFLNCPTSTSSPDNRG